jgi:hypothetical protein
MHNKAKRKLQAAQKRYAEAQATTAEVRAALATGGSWVLYKLAVAEEDAALRKLEAAQAEAA